MLPELGRSARDQGTHDRDHGPGQRRGSFAGEAHPYLHAGPGARM